MDLDTIEEANTFDVVTFVDQWLAAFTCEDALTFECTQSRVFGAVYRDHDVIGFDDMISDNLWEKWNNDLQGFCPLWLSKPQKQRQLPSAVAAEVRMIAQARRAIGPVPEGDLWSMVWRELSYQAISAIGMQVSADLVRSSARAEIREGVIDFCTELAEEYRERMDEYLRSYDWKTVVLIKQSSREVCAQGADLPDAISDLTAFMLPRYNLEATSRDTAGDGVYHAYLVPECLGFDLEDAHLVERWGIYSQSFINVACKAA
ncbi:hypothetical protein [Microvirga tunisiensis]|uniref:Uncharacterized protein n=1 Tax=Microvirga tunisiensis TaxID=2108360 RepID=A0A5N7MHK2_9HYPH|nr:hypothetical protein [Microvirga tunisiensis]MPR07815.1 hypothetical protein [Microvirga tunisiensis]MPR26210.1 hypothetical protein [Microvirga tunisiensis]